MGIDLTGATKATGVAILNGRRRHYSVLSDGDILALPKKHRSRIVSIDSPLGLPRGGDVISRKAGIVRVAEHDLASVGFQRAPALIDSMGKLTLRNSPGGKQSRGFRVHLELSNHTRCCPDILCIPRKQEASICFEGLERLRTSGRGLKRHLMMRWTRSRPAVVDRYFETGDYEAMGIRAKLNSLSPKCILSAAGTILVVCLAGKL